MTTPSTLSSNKMLQQKAVQYLSNQNHWKHIILYLSSLAMKKIKPWNIYKLQTINV